VEEKGRDEKMGVGGESGEGECYWGQR